MREASSVVFVGRVLDAGDEKYKGRPARVKILEKLHNVQPGVDEVNVEYAPESSCSYDLSANTVHVFDALRDRADSKLLHISSCSGSFPIQGREYLLDALRNQAAGGESRIVGKVLKFSYLEWAYTVDAARVVATSGKLRYEAVSDADGAYQIAGVKPGRYQVAVTKPGYAEDVKFNRRSEKFKLHPRIEKIVDEGGVEVFPNACSMWHVRIDPNGTITGTVRDASGAPVPKVAVEVFSPENSGEWADYSLYGDITDAQGRYTLRLLPPRVFDIGLDPTRFGKRRLRYGKTAPRSRRRIRLALGERRDGVDFVLRK